MNLNDPKFSHTQKSDASNGYDTLLYLIVWRRETGSSRASTVAATWVSSCLHLVHSISCSNICATSVQHLCFRSRRVGWRENIVDSWWMLMNVDECWWMLMNVDEQLKMKLLQAQHWEKSSRVSGGAQNVHSSRFFPVLRSKYSLQTLFGALCSSSTSRCL